MTIPTTFAALMGQALPKALHKQRVAGQALPKAFATLMGQAFRLIR